MKMVKIIGIIWVIAFLASCSRQKHPLSKETYDSNKVVYEKLESKGAILLNQIQHDIDSNGTQNLVKFYHNYKNHSLESEYSLWILILTQEGDVLWVWEVSVPNEPLVQSEDRPDVIVPNTDHYIMVYMTNASENICKLTLHTNSGIFEYELQCPFM